MFVMLGVPAFLIILSVAAAVVVVRLGYCDQDGATTVIVIPAMIFSGLVLVMIAAATYGVGG